MALSKLWTNYSVKIGSGYVNGVSDAGVSQGLVTQLEAGDGQYLASFGSLVKGDPGGQFSSLDVAACLTATGISGVAIGSSPATVVFYFRKIAQGGTRDAANAGTHVSVTVSQGILVPRRISARSGQNAHMDCQVVATGSTAPAVSTSANLPGNTPGAAVAYTVGPIKLNGTVLDGLESVDIDLGVNVLSERADSDVYPTFAAVASQRPTIRARGRHIDSLGTITPDGSYFTASQVVVYLRQRAEGGTFTLDATAQHIKFTLGKCRVEVQSVEGDPKSVDITITPWLDTGGPTNPIAVNTASAIT